MTNTVPGNLELEKAWNQHTLGKQAARLPDHTHGVL